MLEVNSTTWQALALAGALFATLVGIRIARKSHELNIAKNLPKIGSVVRLQPTVISGFVHRFNLLTSIYNEGEFPASKLKGNWKLSCSESGHDFILPIWKEHLGKSLPYELEPHELHGQAITDAIKVGKQFTLNIDIEFEYLKLPDNQPQKYSAKYKYDPKHKQMVRAN